MSLEKFIESYTSKSLKEIVDKGGICGTVWQSTFDDKNDGSYDFSKVRYDLLDRSKYNCCMEPKHVQDNINYIINELENNPNRYDLKNHESVHLWHGGQPMMILKTSNDEYENGMSLCVDASDSRLRENPSLFSRLAKLFNF